MKGIYVVILISFSSLLVSGQGKTPALKAYAYLRESAPGIIPKVVNEQGKEVNTGPTAIQSYQFFIEYTQSYNIKPLRIWIDGMAYTVKTERIAQTPYTFSRPGVGSNTEVDTLVRKTNKQVIRLVPDKVLPHVSAAGINTSYPVLEYYFNKKKYRFIFKDIRKLSPMILQ